MFVRLEAFGTQVLGLALRGVEALEGILEAILVLNRTHEGAFREQQLFRPLLHSVDKLVLSIEALDKTQRELGPGQDRLDALELSRVRFEAECEGLLLKADGRLKASSAAEARERQLKRSYDKRDVFAPNGDEAATDEERAVLREVLGKPRLPEEHVPMHEIDAPTEKQLAVRAKWRV